VQGRREVLDYLAMRRGGDGCGLGGGGEDHSQAVGMAEGVGTFFEFGGVEIGIDGSAEDQGGEKEEGDC
jgi:hypothetical protein